MPTKITRREFVSTSTAAGLALGATAPVFGQAPAVRTGGSTPVVIASDNGNVYKNGGTKTGVQLAFEMMTSGGKDVLDALVAGVNLCELDPDEAGVGYGGLPNADGVVQLDSCCMHGPAKRAGGVAGARRRAHAVAGRQGGDGDDRPSPAGRQGRAGLRPQHGLHDRGRPQHREVARAVARVEAPDRSRALPRPEEARARRDDGRPGDGARRAHRPAITSGAPSTATASTPRARSAA